MHVDQAAPPFDPEVVGALRELGGDDGEFLTDLLATYLEQSHANMRALHSACVARDAPAFARAIHMLAGASLNVGAAGMAQMCRAIEQQLKVSAPRLADVASIELELERIERAVGEEF